MSGAGRVPPWDGAAVAAIVGAMLAAQIVGVAVYDRIAARAIGDRIAARAIGDRITARAIGDRVADAAVHEGTADATAADSATITPQRLAVAAGATLAAAAISAMVMLRAGVGPRSLGLFSDDPWGDLRSAVASVLIVTPPLLVVSGLLSALVPYEHPIIDVLRESQGPATILIVVLAAVVAAPLAEEFVFRGVLQGWLEWVEESLPVKPAVPGLLAVGGSSLCFALAHLGHGLGWIPLVGFGVAAGILRRRRGSLLPSVLLHAIFNAVSLGLLLVQL